jgi:phosphatidylglycerol---prolipoprotein diacylglyceryl transferase
VHPIVTEIELFGVVRPIGGYGLLVAIGVLVSGLLVGRAAWLSKLDVGAVIAGLGYTCGAGFLGAAGFFVLVEGLRTGDPMAGIQSPGLVFYGAVPSGALAAYLAARGFKLPFLRIVDLSVPAIAAGHALGRIGCFLGGCCFGCEWHGPWATTYTDPMAPAAHPSVPRHPVPLYEALGLVVLAFVFALAPMKRIGDGRRGLAYVVAYAVLRFSVELLRGDSARGLVLDLVSTSQLVSLTFFTLASIALIRIGLRARSPAPSA